MNEVTISTLEKAYNPFDVVVNEKGDVGFIDLYFYRYRPFDMLSEINSEKRKNGAL